MENPKFDWDKEFENFLDSLKDNEVAKLLALIEKIEEYGLQIAQRQEWVKKLEDNLYEIRVRSIESYLRGIYFQIKANNYWISHGFKKKTNKTPKKEINRGKKTRERILYIKRRDEDD